jgi:hypothetical protein
MNRKFGSALVAFFLIALAGLAFLSPLIPGALVRPGAFLAALVFMTLEFIAIGISLGRGPAGIIIDSRNCMSLSKFQACAWTAIVLSALLVAAAFNIYRGSASGLAVTIPSDLLIAMGISATSLAAAPALLSLKTDQDPTDAALASAGIAPPEAGAAAPAAGSQPPNVGALIMNTTIADASFTDMITGDEVGNATSPDLGKIQQLLVTLLLLGIYGVMITKAFVGPATIATLPPLDQSFIWLMGISHASYLAYKAAPHTPTN